jgi:hypothetical protein
MEGRVDPETKRRWGRYAERKGVPVSDLLEGIGRLLPEEGEKESPFLRQAAALASSIADERSGRAPTD